MIKFRVIWIFLAMAPFSFMTGQELTTVEFNDQKWRIEADQYEITEFNEIPALYLKSGTARLMGSQFHNGVIEFDLAFGEHRNFAGLQFRCQDMSNYEEFYVRPHQSGNPDAMQYTPVFHNNPGWQLYHGKGYSAPYSFIFNGWNHFKLIIKDNRMDVYINDMNQPVMEVYDLKGGWHEGEIGFWNFRGGAYYTNLRIVEKDDPPLFSEAIDAPPAAEGTLFQWEVSNPLPSHLLQDVINLNDLNQEDLEWTEITAEYSGLINLGRLSSATDKSNAVLVRMFVDSDVEQIKRIDFGYSDEVAVYVNNRIMYSGNNRFQSRDYRYLGTIGYFDSVYTPLVKGKNEVIFLVSENLGGWGLKAKMN